MRQLLWLVVLFAAKANAGFLQIDINVLASQTSDPVWSLGVPAGEINASFLIDTNQSTFNYSTQTASDGTTCFSSVDFNFSASLRYVSVGDNLIASGPLSGTGSFGADRPNASCSGDTQFFFSGLSLAFGDLLLGVSTDSFHTISVENVLASQNPAAQLLLQGLYGGFLWLEDSNGFGSGFFGQPGKNLGGMTVKAVPEPATLGLFGMALLAGWVIRRKRSGDV